MSRPIEAIEADLAAAYAASDAAAEKHEIAERAAISLRRAADAASRAADAARDSQNAAWQSFYDASKRVASLKAELDAVRS